jgi:hypothetical protein
MKKILALVSSLCLLILAASCTTEPTTNTTANSNANMSVSKTAAPSEADMIAKEKATWDTLKKKDYDAFGSMLASDFIEVNEEGVFDKPGVIANVKDFTVTDVTYSDWKMLPIDNDAVILTYVLNLTGTFKGEAVPPGPYRAAAAWVSRDGKWLAFYYQQTLVKPMPPAPPPASPTASKPEKMAATPAAKPGETGPDPIANERLVWDLFKSKNFDAFAALLDPAFMELVSTGVYDKAGTVKGVAEMDAAEFELSEWKSAKLDNDAALVTYLVKPTNPKWDTERHTTIWASRAGKWVALLHMGTPVAKPAAKASPTMNMKKM